MTNTVDLSGEESWIDVTLPHIIGQKSFVSGEPEGNRFRVRYYYRGDRRLLARAWFGPGTAGPPMHAHGGSQAALLDELIGSTAWLNGHAVLAGELTVSFRNMLPLSTRVHAEGWVESVEGRKIRTRGFIKSLDGQTLYSEARGIFIIMAAEKFKGIPHQVARQFCAEIQQTWEDAQKKG